MTDAEREEDNPLSETWTGGWRRDFLFVSRIEVAVIEGEDKANVGVRHLGAALGSRSFVEQYVQAKVTTLVASTHRRISFTLPAEM